MKANNLVNADELYLVIGQDENATETQPGLMSAADKVKLNGIADGAEVNVQSDWNVTNTTSDAYIKNKPKALPANGGNADTVNNHTVETDVPVGAVFTDTVYTHPTYTAKTNGLYKITVDSTGHVSGTNLVSKADITALGIPAQDTTYGGAGTSLGLVKSGGDVTISGGIITVNDDSHNHTISNIDNLQATLNNKVDKVEGSRLITASEASKLESLVIGEGGQIEISGKVNADNVEGLDEKLNTKVDKVAGKGLSTNDFTTEEKEKLAGIETGANKTIIDSALSSTSTNPVQNKIINTKFNSIQTDINNKVDAESGKGLSTNDLTTALKSNYDAAYTHSQQTHAPSNAEKNVIVGIQKNGTDLTVNSSTRKVNITVPTKTSELTNDSNFATTTALDAKVDKVTGKGLSTNDYTTAEKDKLASIGSGANKTVVDTALSSTSTNPLQNKAIYTKFNSMQSNIDNKVPSSRTVNGKALTADITLSASDVGALPNTTVIPSIDGLATETYVNNKVASIVDSAPATLDTLNELAAALGDDSNFATTVATQIGNKVDKVDGKGLSTNDYTTAEKDKLASIENGANKTVVDTDLNSTSTNPVENKAIYTKFNSISAEVKQVKDDFNNNIEVVNGDIQTLTQKVNASMTAEDVKLQIQSELNNGVTKVETTTGFTFDDEGLTVSKSGNEMTTQITEDGMTVFRDNTAILIANNVGVDAVNLHATTYLIVGTHSRFEDYGENRTGCFWIGS